MTQAMVQADGADRVLEVLVSGNLSVLSPRERVEYFERVCSSLSLNPLTKPFEFITLNNKLVLYATKACTDQLRQIHNVSISIDAQQQAGDLYIVTATAVDDSGRRDSDMGVVSTRNLSGENLANAMLKAVTKAKRRVTLSICGLGMLDETEIEDIPAASKRPPVVMPQSRVAARVNRETGEVVDSPPWTSDELAALLTEHAMSMRDLTAVCGAGVADKKTAAHAITAWLIANPNKGLRDLINAAIDANTSAAPVEQPDEAQPALIG